MGDLSSIMNWKTVDTAPFDRDLELAVINSTGTQVVAFPCRRLVDSGWIDVETKNGALRRSDAGRHTES